jgi:hypothetical protein
MKRADGAMKRADGAYIIGVPGGNHWFHFPTTTPVILDNIRARLISIFVLYNAVAARITNLHLYDGPRSVKQFDGLDLSGNHGGDIDPTNQWHAEPPLELRFSLGVSVRVEFANAGPEQPRIAFHTVGADFQTPYYILLDLNVYSLTTARVAAPVRRDGF